MERIAFMNMKAAKFYALRLDDLRPILWQTFGEPANADELVYLVDPHVNDVVIADVCIGMGAESSSPWQP